MPFHKKGRSGKRHLAAVGLQPSRSCWAPYKKSKSLSERIFCVPPIWKPSQSLLRNASSPERGSFISGYGKVSAFPVKYGLTGRCIKAPPSGELAPKVPERVQPQPAALRSDPTCENVFGAARRLQQRRLPPAADTGRSCWGSGQQDASECEADAGSRKSRTNTKIKMEFPLLLSERSGDNSKSFILKRGTINAKHRPDLRG